MEGVIDTCVLVDYILMDSEQHERARLNLEKIDRGFLPSVVVEELVHALERLKLSKETIDEKVRETLESYDVLSVSAGNLAEAAAHIMKESGARFKRFNDNVILSVAKAQGLPVLTFDGDFISECKSNGVELIYE